MPDVNEIFDSAFERFLREERDNIAGLVSERNLCGHLARIINENLAGTGFIADPEYNRQNLNRIKTTIDDELNVITITCDVVLHRRGSAGPENNLIAIEMKKSTQKEKKKNDDRNRLRALTKQNLEEITVLNGAPEHVRGYQLGVYLELDVESFSFAIEKYADGEWIENSNATLPQIAG